MLLLTVVLVGIDDEVLITPDRARTANNRCRFALDSRDASGAEREISIDERNRRPQIVSIFDDRQSLPAAIGAPH
jgi:hypothetical protein